MEYKEFKGRLDTRLNQSTLQLLEKIISEPNRYVGLFRVSSTKEKLIQNKTQSREIKFGDFMEEIVETYLQREGYNVHPIKEFNIKVKSKTKKLRIDQLFDDNITLYLIEQKIRDDHDSTKKVGQFENFVKKIELVSLRFPHFEIKPIMWFIDDAVKKNYNYYLQQSSELNLKGYNSEILYGKELFDNLRENSSVWESLISNLIIYRNENSDGTLNIPDFRKDDDVLEALVNLSKKNWNKLNSDDEIMKQIRSTLFGESDILQKAKKARSDG
jgi:hypothetical protein